MKNYFTLFIVLMGIFTATVAIAAEHEHEDHDVVIGLTDVDGGRQQITLVEEHALEHIELEFKSILGIYYGSEVCWIPGHENLHILDYNEGTPPAGHYVLELVPVSMPPSVLAFEETTRILDGSNYAFELRWDTDHPDEGWHFHNHITWGLDPIQVTIGETVTATFKLVDTSGQYLDSEVFEVELTAVPEPATLALLGFGALVGIRKKAKR